MTLRNKSEEYKQFLFPPKKELWLKQSNFSGGWKGDRTQIPHEENSFVLFVLKLILQKLWVKLLGATSYSETEVMLDDTGCFWNKNVLTNSKSLFSPGLIEKKGISDGTIFIKMMLAEIKMFIRHVARNVKIIIWVHSDSVLIGSCNIIFACDIFLIVIDWESRMGVYLNQTFLLFKTWGCLH